MLKIPWNLKKSEELGNRQFCEMLRYLSAEMFSHFLILWPPCRSSWAVHAGGICFPPSSGPCSTNFIIYDFLLFKAREFDWMQSLKLKIIINTSQQAFLFNSHYLLTVSGSPYSSFLIPACFHGNPSWLSHWQAFVLLSIIIRIFISAEAELPRP